MTPYTLCLDSESKIITTVYELSQSLTAGWRPCGEITEVATTPTPIPATLAPVKMLPAVGAGSFTYMAIALVFAAVLTLAIRSLLFNMKGK